MNSVEAMQVARSTVVRFILTLLATKCCARGQNSWSHATYQRRWYHAL